MWVEAGRSCRYLYPSMKVVGFAGLKVAAGPLLLESKSVYRAVPLMPNAKHLVDREIVHNTRDSAHSIHRHGGPAALNRAKRPEDDQHASWFREIISSESDC